MGGLDRHGDAVLVGKLLIVTFLSRFAFRSAYGITGIFLVLLLWVYYSTQIFLLGAEFMHQYALATWPRAGEGLEAAVRRARPFPGPWPGARFVQSRAH